jgi:hypothetical protein
MSLGEAGMNFIAKGACRDESFLAHFTCKLTDLLDCGSDPSSDRSDPLDPVGGSDLSDRYRYYLHLYLTRARAVDT